MSNVDEASSAISAAVSKSDETDATIGSAASTVDELTSALQGAGIEDRVTMSEEAKSKLDEAATQQAAAKQLLEQALAIISGLKGLLSGGGSSAGSPAPLEHSDMVSGEELVGQSEPEAKGFRGLMDFLGRRTDDVSDVAESTGSYLDIGWQAVGHEPTPSTGLQASVGVEPAPSFVAPPAPQVGTGSLILAGFTASMLTAKTSEKAGKVAHRMWKARGRDKQQ